MMIPLKNDGTDQYFYTDLVEIDGSGNVLGPLTDDTDGVALTGGKLVFEEYKKDPIDISNPITWKAAVGRWKCIVPVTQGGSRVITTNGAAQAFISTDPQITVLKTVDLQIGNVGGGGMEVLTITNHDSENRQIDTGDETITAARVNKIQDLTTGMILYDSLDPKKNALFQGVAGPDITVSAGVITYLYRADSIGDSDVLRIEVNPELS